jgi:oligoribonuclease NrnB/cAMP/cGMP phosphodiesterase (DHH superfamily)
VDFDKVCIANGFECPKIVFDMNMSGGRLAWNHFYANACMPPPGLVDYTEDRDLWRWQLLDSKAVNACLRSYPLDFGLWNQWGNLTAPVLHDLLFKEGEAILRREQQIIDDHVRHAREIEMNDYKILSVNATVLFSEIAGELAKDRPFGACYFDRQDGKRQWSLRSRDGGIDVSGIAKLHGGGGHRNAAGFEESHS